MKAIQQVFMIADYSAEAVSEIRELTDFFLDGLHVARLHVSQRLASLAKVFIQPRPNSRNSEKVGIYSIYIYLL